MSTYFSKLFSGSKYVNLILVAIIATLTFFIYYNSLNNQFLNDWDDGVYITNNPKDVYKRQSWNRLFMIYDAMKLGISIKTIQKLTQIDMWFLEQIEQMIAMEREIEKHNLSNIPKDLLYEAKQKGYADRQVAHLLRCLESEVYKKRNELGIKRVYKLVDTCAAEFEAKTPYYYSTFEDENESVRSDKKKVVILGLSLIHILLERVTLPKKLKTDKS